jgi:hypothetical protein
MRLHHTIATSHPNTSESRHEPASTPQDRSATGVRPFPVYNWAWATSSHYDWMDQHASYNDFD